MRYVGLFGAGLILGMTFVACGSDDGSELNGNDGGADAFVNNDGGNVANCPAPCSAGQKCSSKGRCIPEGTCDGDQDCADGLKCDIPTSTCLPGGCGHVVFPAELVPPNLLIVLDRSCSMKRLVDNVTKWKIAVDAINQLTKTYSTKIRFGLTMFPDTVEPKCEQDGPVPFPVGLGNDTKIQTILTASLQETDKNYPKDPCVTNLDTAMEQAATDLGFTDATRQSFAMLVTDGGQEGCPGSGTKGAIAAITLMATNKVKTFVVGFGGGVAIGPMDDFAVAGQVPAANVSPKFYNAEDHQALDKALQTIASLTLSCTFQLGSVPPGSDKLFVFVDNKKTQVPRDPNKVNGWDYDPVNNQVTVYGKTCDDFKAGVIKAVDVVYGCPPPTVN